MRAMNWLKRLAGDQRGNALLVGAACMPLLIGAAALGVDTIYMALTKRQLQRSADSGALAGAYALVQNKPVNAAVTYDLQLNNGVAITGTPTVENAPTTGSFAGNTQAVRVVLTANVPMAFFSVFNKSTATVSTEATAAIIFNGKWCMLSLEDGSAPGVTFSGSADVDLGCGIASNSKSSSAIVAGGSSKIKATPISAVGGVPSSSHYVSPTTLIPYAPKQSDPFSSLPTPSVPASCSNKLSIGTQENYTIPTRTDQTYCFKGMDVKGTLNLPPGTYYIDGSVLDFGAQAVVNGTGVTFILTSSNATSNPASIATLSMNGGATLKLSAPKSGTYEGVIMYQDPRATLGNTVTINGNAASVLEGAFYFPRAYLTFSGTAGMTTHCIQLIGRRLEFTGNASIDNTCPTDGGAKSRDMILVRLVQ